MSAIWAILRPLIGGIGWQSLLGLAVAAALVWAVITVRLADRAAGAAGATAKIDAANAVARDKADAAQQQVLDCLPPKHWVRGEGCKP
jgi:mannose/fructose/N-acetylgalactosamine-specific phosphotransferase system component IID